MPYPVFHKKWANSFKSSALKITFYVISFLFLYLVLPVYLKAALVFPSFMPLFLFYPANILILLYLLKKKSGRKYLLNCQAQDLQEKLNILNDENLKELKNNISLQAKIIRYNRLKKVVEEINKNLELDSVADNLVTFAFSFISNNNGVCVLYLIDSQAQKLGLFKTKKDNEGLIIRAKEGDIFDYWALRHAIPLLIEDTKRDFRFDLEKLKLQDLRPVSSLISSPFISENRFLGILRLDNPKAHFYSQDDLRFLATICGLGAVALENSQLFKATQDLAIHDGLTSLYTKGYFLERLKEECKRTLAQQASLSLFMLDIDYFKNYNDKFGHTAGDIVLRKISQILIESLKGLEPVISRFGGEEFCIILPGLDKKKACSLAQETRERIEKEKIILRRHKTNITVSIGVASFPVDATEEDSLIMQADKAMYEAKKRGRNQVCCI